MCIRNRLTLFCVALAVFALPSTDRAFSQGTSSQVKPGINLAGLSDWNTELPLVDVFRLSRRWISQQEGKDWGQGPTLAVDAQGWVTSLQPGCWAETPLCTVRGGHYPSGEYTVFYEGAGELDVWGAAKILDGQAGKMTLEVNASQGGFFLRIMSTDPDNYIRNIRVIMPGFLDSYQSNPWHPVFLERWSGFACLRFMNYMRTNGSQITTWDERPMMDDATWTVRGVPLEMMCDLANRLNCDPWFCMPHQADDDYVRQFARQVRQLLNPELQVYIEYSNEVWNASFPQHQYAGKRGQELGFANTEWGGAWTYTAFRSKQIFDIWEQEFGGRQRLVRVLASQSSVTHVSEQVLRFQDAYRSADVLAIAPYFGWAVRAADADQVVSQGIDHVLDHLQNRALPSAIKAMQDQKAVADKYGLKLVAYEAGQHLVGLQGGENHEQMTQLFQQANRHPRMGDLYRQYYDAWSASGGELLCVYESVSAWSKWGSWGLLEHFDGTPADSPKYRATVEWAAELRNSQPAKGD